ncbi:hypothetical protein BJY01DRAFT_256041 [Aspergillus pseudoustus]|uniref:BZIP domain-containing protein n=1 Tax=Aspergillus pseudoustus TaxID=1810923 RepID=A0ABR4IF30_9EURO
MDNYVYSDIQTPYSASSPLGMPWGSKTQFQNDINYIGVYQDGSTHLPPPSTTSMSFGYTIPADIAAFSPPVTPSHPALLADISLPPMHSKNGQTNNAQSVKRRMQNREAQRRFRERKDEQQQILEQKAAKLEARIAELSTGLSRKFEEESQILKEKEALAREVRELRERWLVIERLLQGQSGQQALATLLSGVASSPDTSSSPANEP